LFILAIGSSIEQRRLAARRDVLTVDGVLANHWTKRERRSTNRFDYWHWEGFSVGGIDFVYTRDVEQNHFHNGGSRWIELHDGMRVRLRYIQEQNGDKLRNHILRFERAVD
jgi:hypothetical protein